MKQKILIFTATYNEVDNISSLIDQILSLHLNADILVVDDDSPDGTGALLAKIASKDSRVNLVHRYEKLGLGSAHKLAFQFAKENNYSVLVTLDADHSHDPNDIPRLIGNLDDFDFVIGSRYVRGGACSYRGYRNFISRLANFSARMLLGIPTKECTTSFRAFNATAITEMCKRRFLSQGYSFFLESIFAIHTADLKIAELPINFIDRKHGISKIPKFETLNGMIMLLRLFIARILNFKGNYQKNIEPDAACYNCSSFFLNEVYSETGGHAEKLKAEAYKCTSMTHSAKPQVVECLQCGLKFAPKGVYDSAYLQHYKEVEDEVYLENLKARRLTFNKLIKKLPSTLEKKSHLLEVGAYCGIFGDEIVKHGWSYVGVEPSAWASSFARETYDLDVYEGTLEQNIPVLRDEFDMIVAWDVLEHIQQPFEFLDLVHQKLKPSGYFCFSTIDIDSNFAKLCGSNWPWIMDMHVYYFSSRGLEKILTKHGFELQKTRTYFHWISLKYFIEKVGSLMPGPLAKVFNFVSKFVFFNLVFPIGFGDVKLYVCKKIPSS